MYFLPKTKTLIIKFLVLLVLEITLVALVNFLNYKITSFINIIVKNLNYSSILY